MSTERKEYAYDVLLRGVVRASDDTEAAAVARINAAVDATDDFEGAETGVWITEVSLAAPVVAGTAFQVAGVPEDPDPPDFSDEALLGKASVARSRSLDILESGLIQIRDQAQRLIDQLLTLHIME